MLKVRPSKIPARAVVADDLVIVVDGVEYRPHEGEETHFRSRVRPEDLVKAMQLQGLTLSPERTAEQLAEQLRELRGFLATRIVSTEWTDEEGEPYASVEEMLLDADFEELGWLMTKVLPDRSAAQGEGSTPST